MNVEQQLDTLRRGTTEIISEDDLRQKLQSGKRLRIKLGVDPTAKDVTLGWAVVLRKIRDFQNLGHTGCIVIGDFTAQIGDPSGKSKTRKQLSREEVQANVEAVQNQLFKILIRERTEISYNADWLGKMSFEEVIRLCSRYTVARILERDDFAKRLEEHRPIAMHELLYPLCQGMDSVELKADVEIGGNDQKFNNLVGRTLMEQYGQAPQVVLLCPLLVGTDGAEKMSQSLGNYIGITESPNEMFGKTMSIPDELIRSWFELCTDVSLVEVDRLLTPGLNPRDAKRHLAREIVSLYHGQDAGAAAEEYFTVTFSQKRQPDTAIEAALPDAAVEEGFVNMPSLLVFLELAKSNGAAKELIRGGAVALDGEKVTDMRVSVDEARGRVLKVGKHSFRKIV